MSVTRKTSLLIVDDDRLFVDSVHDFLDDTGIETVSAYSLRTAKEICQKQPFDVVLLDNNLPDGKGLEIINDVLSLNDHAKIILATAFPSFDNAVQALRQGVYDYISKPIDLDELQTTIERAVRTTNLEAVEQVDRYYRNKEKKATSFIGTGKVYEENKQLILKAAASNTRVLITGETGTGKNVVAKAIHFASERANAPFISVNCAALPETLIEAELFGAEKGAFTGASQTRKGIFELADGGTILLDEIGEMPLALQSKLLSVLEGQKIRRIGSATERTVDVRIIAATNVDLEQAVTAKKFRSDLFYRLSVIRIHLPPLRERKDDIPLLCKHFVEQLAPGQNIEIPDVELEKLKDYSFPGNVRELRNIIERCLILQEGRFIYPSKLIDFNQKTDAPETVFAVQKGKMQTLAEVEKKYILEAFEQNQNNITRTAQILGISLSTLKRKLREYGYRPSLMRD